MKMLHRKSKWEKTADRVLSNGLVKKGLSAAAGLVGVSIASAALSTLRKKQDS